MDHHATERPRSHPGETSLLHERAHTEHRENHARQQNRQAEHGRLVQDSVKLEVIRVLFPVAISSTQMSQVPLSKSNFATASHAPSGEKAKSE